MRTLFPAVNERDAAAEIDVEAVYTGLRLPPLVCSQIEAFALAAPLQAPFGSTFFYKDVTRGKTSDGLEVPIGGVADPMRCPAVRAVVDDPKLRAIVRKYLRYDPAKVEVILLWTFAADYTEEECRKLKFGTIDYHYDSDGYNFVYAHFYIRDTDGNSGAHVMMKRSHKRKPLRMLLGRASASQDDVRREFGIENELMIEGPAGTGFVQHASCYHRATRATQRDRLMLTIRFV